MYLTRNQKLVFLWALYRAYRDDDNGVFVTSYTEAVTETRVARNTLRGIFKRLVVLDAFSFTEAENNMFVVNMSDYKEFTSMTMPMVDSVLSMRAKRKKNVRILSKGNNELKQPKRKDTNTTEDGKNSLEFLESGVVLDTPYLTKVGEVKNGEQVRKKANKSRTKVQDFRVTVGTNVIALLNEKAGRSYKTSKANQKFVNAILAQGYSEQDLLAVVAYKCGEWIDTQYSEYLRPSTLFGDNFESYLHSATTEPNQSNRGTRNVSL